MQYVFVFLFGLLFVLSAYLIVGLEIDSFSLAKIHKKNSLLYFIDFSPFVLTLILYLGRFIKQKNLLSYRFESKLHNKIVSNSFDAIVVANALGIIQYVNESCCTIFGYKKNELIGENIMILMPNDYRDLHRKGMVNHLKDGTKKVIDQGAVLLKGLRKNQESFPLELKLTSFIFRKKTFFSAVISDKTKEQDLLKERENVLVQLEKQKSFYESILDEIPVDIAVFDKNHKYQFVNPAAIKNDKYRALIIGKDDYEYNKALGRDKKTADSRREKFNHVLKQKKPIEWRDVIRGEDGDEKTILRKMYPIFNEGELDKVFGFGLDISDALKKDIEIENLSKFPKENPHIVARFSMDLDILYLNETGQSYISKFGFNEDDFNDVLKDFIKRSIQENKNLRNDVVFQEYIFDTHVIPLIDKHYVNVYAVDVTEYRNEIKRQKNDLLNLSEKLKQYNKKLEIEVDKRTKSLREINIELESSIKYAKRLQRAVIAHQNVFNGVFYETFVIYQPKELIGGDFYFTYEINNFVIFGVADCTGHGIPGAMLSLLCMTLLDYVVNTFEIVFPSKILDKVNQLLIKSFQSKEYQVKDGMDISLFSYDYNESNLYFSGANSKSLLILDNESVVLKGTSRPIGFWMGEINEFEQQKIKVSKGDQLFLFSDGLPDQFGGPRNKKLKYKNFYKQLEKSLNLSANGKKESIEELIDEWKGQNSQLDDITVAGVKF